MIFTTNLLIYHTGLVNNNMTTKEELKKHFKNPYGDFYSRNCSLNWRNVICPIINKKSILDILKWENEIPNETEEKDDGVKGEKGRTIYFSDVFDAGYEEYEYRGSRTKHTLI